MLTRFETKQIIGKYFTGSKMCFHPSRLELFTPINNTILHIDLDRNKSGTIPFAARSKVESITLCNQGELAVITDSENRVYLFNFQNKQQIGSKNFKLQISDVVFSHNNKFFVIAAGRFLFFYEKPSSNSGILLEPLSLIKKFNSKCVEGINCVKFTQDDRYVIYSGDDHAIRLTPVFKTAYHKKDFELYGHKNKVIDFSDTLVQNKHLITFDINGLFLVWEIVNDEKTSEQEKQKSFKRIKESSAKSGNLAEIQNEETLDFQSEVLPTNFSELEKTLESSKFILKAKHIIFQDGIGIKHYKFHENKLLIAFSNSTFSLYTIDANEAENFKVILTFKINESFAKSVIFHKNQSVICIANNLNGIAMWDYRSKNFLLSQTSSLQEVTAFAFNEKGVVLAVGDEKGSVRLFDTKTFFGVVSFNDALSKITQIKFMKANTMLTASLDGVVRAYDLGKYKLFREMRPPVHNQILALEVEKDGEIVIGSGVDPYEIYVWSLKTGQIVEVLSNHMSPVHLLQYSPQKQILISASWDRTVRAFHIFSKDKAEDKIEIGDRIVDLKLAKNERFFAVATMRNEIQFFLLDDMQLFSLIDLKSIFQTGVLSSVDLSFDGKTAFAVGSINGIVSVDIEHRCVTGKIGITMNRDYKFNGEKLNSKYIVDGVDTKKNYLNYQLENSKVLLPGSLGQHAKEQLRPIFNASEIRISPEGQYLTVACSEGLSLFGLKDERHYWKITTDVDQSFLKGLLRENKHIEFFVTCLHLRMFSLLELIIWRLNKVHVYSIVRSLTPEMVFSLFEFLRIRIEECRDVEKVVVWIRALLMFKVKELGKAEVKPFVTFLSMFVGYRFEEFVGAAEFNQEAINYLKAQISE